VNIQLFLKKDPDNLKKNKPLGIWNWIKQEKKTQFEVVW
jgi:hypothetical protein